MKKRTPEQEERYQARLAKGLAQGEAALRYRVGLVRPEPLCMLLGTTRMTLWRWYRSGKFPKPVLLGAPSTDGDGSETHAPGSDIAFRASEVAEWIEDRPLAQVRPVPRRKDQPPTVAA